MVIVVDAFGVLRPLQRGPRSGHFLLVLFLFVFDLLQNAVVVMLGIVELEGVHFVKPDILAQLVLADGGAYF